MGVEKPSRRPRTQQLGVLALLCLAQFLVVLDTSIVNVALPRMGTDLAFRSESSLQYIISLYALTFGGLLVLAGRVADVLGRRRIFVSGLLLFSLSSLVCGIAPTAAVLLIGRTVQGAGSALVSSAALALLMTLFNEGPERNRALGAWGAVGGAAGACGLLLGGALTDLLGWPWIFFINLPLALGATWFAPQLLPAGRTGQHPRSLDLPGAIAITGGLGLLIFGFAFGEQHGYRAGATQALLFGAVLLLAAFVLIERRAQWPLVSFRLFRVHGVAVSNISALVLTTIVASNLFFTTLYVQQVLNLTPLETGLAFLPNSLLVVTGSAIASKFARRVGDGTMLVAGMVLLVIACVLLSGVSLTGSYVTDVLPGFALTGLGQGMAFVAVTMGATRGVEDRDHGLASGVVNSAQQVGFALGMATVVTAAVALSVPGQDRLWASSYSIGYLLDAGLAAFCVGPALSLARSRKRQVVDRQPPHGEDPRSQDRPGDSGSTRGPNPRPTTKGRHMSEENSVDAIDVLGISGSLREGSYNTALLRVTRGLTGPGQRMEIWDGLAAIPPFNEDHEPDPGPAVLGMCDAVRRADALLIAAPEYNTTVPGQLKNALDWLSRPPGQGPLAGKIVAVIGASQSNYGAEWSQLSVKQVLEASGAFVVGEPLHLALAHEAFTHDGRLRNEEHVLTLTRVLARLAESALAVEPC